MSHDRAWDGVTCFLPFAQPRRPSQNRRVTTDAHDSGETQQNQASHEATEGATHEVIDLATDVAGAEHGIERDGTLAEAIGVLAELLRDAGVSDAEIEGASENGTLHMLALERLIAMDPAHYTLEEVTAESGLDTVAVRAYWRALGFPDARPGEKLFSDSDLEMLESVVPFIDEGSLDPMLALQMARVIGSSLARIATAQIEAIEQSVSRQVEAMAGSSQADEPKGDQGDDHGRQGEVGVPRGDEEDLVAAARRAAELLPMMPNLMEFVWRRHLGAAARRRIMRAAGETATEGVTIGFADLVGFTAQTQQLAEEELAEVVSRFESIAYDVVAEHHGRVIKTIGDEVMFMADDVRDAAEIAADLATRYREDDALSDVRVALAVGEVLERDGDVYGPVVNLAHRIVTVAYPGAVVVAPEVREVLKDDEDFSFRSIRSHYLKDIGRIPLFTLRRAEDVETLRGGREDPRRRARRRFMLERRLLRQQHAAERAEQNSLEPELHNAFLDDGADGSDATTGEYEALSEAVLEADIAPDLQVELLTDIEAARRLHALEEEAQLQAQAADLEAERRLEEIEEEAERKVRRLEQEARHKVEEALLEAEEKARRANEDASRKVRRVAEAVERKADRAEREARREARRKAGRRASERKVTEKRDQDDDEEPVADAGGVATDDEGPDADPEEG